MQENKKFVVSRSWRKFGRQQAIGLLSLYKKIHWLEPEFHFNINEEVEQRWVNYVHNFIPKENLNLYNDNFFKEYAQLKNIPKERINKFDDWKWIYHILLYYYLYENGVTYILTYDDDILFNSKEITEITHNIENQIPFGIGEYNGFADKTMFKKLIPYFKQRKIDINYLFWACYPQNLAVNSGFLGTKTQFFENYDSINDIVDMFKLEKYEHKDELQWFEMFEILLQEQSFLVINNKSFYNHEFETLWVEQGYNIEWKDIDEFYPMKTKLEHYIHIHKYKSYYKDRLDQEQNRLDKLISEKKHIDKFYELDLENQ